MHYILSPANLQTRWTSSHQNKVVSQQSQHGTFDISLKQRETYKQENKTTAIEFLDN